MNTILSCIDSFGIVIPDNPIGRIRKVYSPGFSVSVPISRVPDDTTPDDTIVSFV